MKAAGALRIAHVMGLMRIFCIPAAKRPSDERYVSYPIDDLLTTLALESQEQQCIVFGEELDTVPDDLRPVMTEPKATISDYAHYYTQPQSIMSRSTYM